MHNLLGFGLGLGEGIGVGVGLGAAKQVQEYVFVRGALQRFLSFAHETIVDSLLGFGLGFGAAHK